MFVDLWIFGIFAILFGFCAIWNQRAGISKGVEGTLDFLVDKGIIEIDEDETKGCEIRGCASRKVKLEIEIKVP